MKKVLLGTVAFIAVAAPASAADLAARPYVKAPPAVIPMYDWSGFYIGIMAEAALRISAGTCSMPAA
ncbi:opacity protein-like surface antigen [Bradyrhizobium ottawaense]